MTSAPRTANGPVAASGAMSGRVICVLLALYFLTRLWSLGALPIFLDEAVHIQWAERLYGEGRILRPVGAGRLLAVMAYGGAQLFDDRLLAARFIATLAGAVTLTFTVLLAGRLFGSRAGAIAGFLYIVSPFALVYDRLALSDGFLCASITGLMFATWTLLQNPDRPSARLMVALLVVLSVTAKVSGLLFFLTLPFAVSLLAKDRRKALWTWMRFGAIGLLCASPMLWFFASNGAEISAQHIVDPGSLGTEIALPLLLSTLSDMRDWLLAYFNAPALLFAAVSVALLRDGRALWLGASVVTPFLLFALFSQPWSARYVLPVLPPFLILVAGGIVNLAGRFQPSRRPVATLAAIMLVSMSSLSFDRRLLSDPAQAPYPSDDRLQFVTGWPSGYGVGELASRLAREAQAGPVIAFVDTGGTRTVPTSLAILVGNHPEIQLVEGDLGSAEFLASINSEAAEEGAFAILGPRPESVEMESLFLGVAAERLQVFERPGGEWVATLFRLRPNPGPDHP